MRDAEKIDVGPFLKWFDGRLEKITPEAEAEGRHPMVVVLGEIGWEIDAGMRRIYAYRHETSRGAKDKIFGALDHAGADISEIYPDLVSDVELEPEAYCDRCHELVTPIRGVCPWCDGNVVRQVGRSRIEKRYCRTCDQMMIPAQNKRCWRCGGRLSKGIPYDSCECGCGKLIHRFDGNGRRVSYVRGHAPRSLERASQVPTEPFARYLEDRLRKLDPLAALAREHGISRELVVAVLRRDSETVSRDAVRRALWVFGNNGTGKPRRPDAVSFFALYPEDRRARTCPRCGNGKAPHAEMCKACRVREDRRRVRPTPERGARLSEEALAEARRLNAEGLGLRAIAVRLFDRTAYASIRSLESALRYQFNKRGWPIRKGARNGSGGNSGQVSIANAGSNGHNSLMVIQDRPEREAA